METLPLTVTVITCQHFCAVANQAKESCYHLKNKRNY